jgi:hypothetical protein
MNQQEQLENASTKLDLLMKKETEEPGENYSSQPQELDNGFLVSSCTQKLFTRNALMESHSSLFYKKTE